VSGKRLIRRIAVVLLGAVGVLLFLGVVDAKATPIQPDVKQVLHQQEQGPVVPFAPARAGWNGPEAAPAAQASPNPVLEAIGPAASDRAVRASLLSAVVPDPRAIAAIVLVILLLRRMSRTSKAAARAQVPVAPENAKLGRAA
jgi:hypothetical protein